MWKAPSVGLVLGATAAFAQAPSATDGDARGPGNNPDQIVCEKQVEIGSRLASRRVCRTRREWQEYRLEARKTAEKVQYFKPSCERPPC